MTRTQDASVNRNELEKTKPANETLKADKTVPRHWLSGSSDAKRSVPEWWNWRRTEDGPHEKRRGTLKNGNRSGDPQTAPRCGAKTRRGTGCQAQATPNGRRCLDGGLGAGPKTMPTKSDTARSRTETDPEIHMPHRAAKRRPAAALVVRCQLWQPPPARVSSRRSRGAETRANGPLALVF
jgi:hypothetical protein